MDVAQLLERHWRTIAVTALATAIIASGLSFLRPLEHSSTMRLFIIQESSPNQNTLDSIRSAERVADILSQFIYTQVFFDKVNRAGFDINKDYFKKDENRRRAQWADMVATRVTHETGFLEIIVYHTDKTQASEIARAIGFVLTTEGNNFVGGADLDIQLVDTPLQSHFPVRPNIPLNAFLGAVIGIVLSALYLVVGEAKRLKAHHERHREVPLGGSL
jgi:capsular polysaccharide biosynthesis protein